MESIDKGQEKKKIAEVKTFPVPFTLGEIKESISISTENSSKPSKEQIINQAFKLHSQGNFSEAAKLYQYLINQGGNDHRVFNNYGASLKDLGKLQEAENSYRKAIKLNPNFGMAHLNLGLILKDLGKSKDAELALKKAIELNPNNGISHYALSTLYSSNNNLVKAIDEINLAIQNDPNNYDFKGELTRLRYIKGEFDDNNSSNRSSTAWSFISRRALIEALAVNKSLSLQVLIKRFLPVFPNCLKREITVKIISGALSLSAKSTTTISS